VELLVSSGFDVDAAGRSDIRSNQPWYTALHVAGENGRSRPNPALNRTLLDLGADSNIPDKHYRSIPSTGPDTSTNPPSPTCSKQ
jgi:hypothetical protein